MVVSFITSNRIARNKHEQNLCEVIASSYNGSMCSSGGHFSRTTVCYIPVWKVTYTFVEETCINAIIEHSGLKTTVAAQNMLHQHQVSGLASEQA